MPMKTFDLTQWETGIFKNFEHKLYIVSYYFGLDIVEIHNTLSRLYIFNISGNDMDESDENLMI